MKLFIKSIYPSLPNTFSQTTSRLTSSFLRMALFVWLLGIESILNSCPTCLGNLEIDTPPLFSKEYEKQYALYDDGTLEIPGITQESVDERQS